MLNFEIDEQKINKRCLTIKDLDVGDTFVYESAFDENGLDLSEVIVYLKVDDGENDYSAVELNHHAQLVSIQNTSKLLEVELTVTGITLK